MSPPCSAPKTSCAKPAFQVVCLEREPAGGGFTFIEHDLRRLLFDRTRGLQLQGCRNIVLLTGPKEYSSEEALQLPSSQLQGHIRLDDRPGLGLVMDESKVIRHSGLG